jgi:hypothetical protein
MDLPFASEIGSEIAVSSKRLAIDAAPSQSGKSSSNELFQRLEAPSGARLPRTGSICVKVSRFDSQLRGYTAI